MHPFTHTFTHQRRLAAMQGTNQLVRSNRGLGVSLRDTSTRPGRDRTGNPPAAGRQLLPPEPHRPRTHHLPLNRTTTASHKFARISISRYNVYTLFLARAHHRRAKRYTDAAFQEITRHRPPNQKRKTAPTKSQTYVTRCIANTRRSLRITKASQSS